MSKSWPNAYPYWPKYLQYPTAIRRSRRPVPNASSVHSPQAQFASLYRPPGAASFDPYSYEIQDVPLYLQQPPLYVMPPPGLEAASSFHSSSGASGDIARLPLGYGEALSEGQSALLAAESVKAEGNLLQQIGLLDADKKPTTLGYIAAAAGLYLLLRR